MGIALRLAAHRAQAEALPFIEACGFKPAVIENGLLAQALLDEQFAVIGALEGGIEYPLGGSPADACLVEK